MKRKVLVTGGAGFIGSHLVRALLEKGYDVSVVDNFATGKTQNLEEVSSDIRLLSGDIRNPNLCRQALDCVEIVFHLAALGSVERSIENPIETHEVNSTGTLNLLQAAKEKGVKRFIYSSSASVYGDSETLPKKESMGIHPKSPYAVSKAAGEYYARVFWELYHLETVSLRYFNVFGPRQDPHSQYAAVIPKFIRALLTGEKPVIFGDGLQSRAFTYVDNVVLANLLAGETRENIFGHVFNIASRECITLLNLFEALAGLAKADVKPLYQDTRRGDIRHSYADISEAMQSFQYEPQVPLLKGIEKTFDWFKENYVWDCRFL